jgi:hypothetical protein
MPKIRRDHDTGKNMPSAKYANRNPGYHKGDQRAGGGGSHGGGGKHTGPAVRHERADAARSYPSRKRPMS